MAHTLGVTTADPFGIADDNLALVKLDQPENADNDAADNSVGEFVPASQIAFGATTNITANYKAQINGSITVEPTLGGSATALLSLEINTTKGARTTATANGHAHVGGTGSTHEDSGRAATVPSFNGFGASAFGLTLGPAAAELQSGRYRVEIMHEDDDDASGNFLCGSSFGEKHTASFEAVSDTPFVAPEGWLRVDKGPSEGNRSHKRQTMTIVKYVAAPA